MSKKDYDEPPSIGQMVTINGHLAKQIRELQAQLATAKNKRLQEVLKEIDAVSCGETQIESDGCYDDGDGLKWIYDKIQALKPCKESDDER